jgi:hypothetical protein
LRSRAERAKLYLPQIVSTTLERWALAALAGLLVGTVMTNPLKWTWSVQLGVSLIIAGTAILIGHAIELMRKPATATATGAESLKVAPTPTPTQPADMAAPHLSALPTPDHHRKGKHAATTDHPKSANAMSNDKRDDEREAPVFNQHNEGNATGYQMYKPNVTIGQTDASPTNPPKWKCTIVKSNISDGTTVMLYIESNARLAHWRAALKDSEKARLVRADNATAEIPPFGGRPASMQMGGFENDITVPALGQIHLVGSDDAIAPGQAIILSFKEMPTAVWAGSGDNLWPIDLSTAARKYF